MFALQLIIPRSVNEYPLIMVDLPIPEPGPGQVLLRIRACGVCHTDLHIVEGEIHPPILPITPGHQVVGVVERMGTGVEGTVHLGQRVGVPWLHQACGSCAFCLRGNENLCPNALFTGYHVNGGFSEWMLAQARWVLPLPDELSDTQAAPLLCAGIIGYRSLRLSEIKPGECLGLVGFGASAHLAIQLARFWKCEVFVFTRSRQHQDHAIELGASWAGSIDENVPKQLDRAIIFAPSGELVPKTLTKLIPGGTLAINAVFMSDIPVIPYSLLYGERTIRSVANATYLDGVEFLRIAVQAGIHSTVTLYPFTEVNQALQDLKASQINGEAVLIQ
jgi:propanol-preferring alcohol dehydrogenase